MTVTDVSGKAIANLATEELKHPAPVFHGDTLFVESEVLEVTPSRSKPDRGIVKVQTDVYKQDGTLVASSSAWCSCRGRTRLGGAGTRRPTSSKEPSGG